MNIGLHQIWKYTEQWLLTCLTKLPIFPGLNNVINPPDSTTTPGDFFFYTQVTVAAVPNWIFDLQTSNYKLSHLFSGYAQITSLGLIIHSLRITVIKTEKAITSSTNWFLLDLRWLFNLLEPALLDKIAHNMESKVLSLGTEQ